MAWNELAETLLELVKSIAPPAAPGLVVTEAELEVPLEVGSAVDRGRLVFYGTAPHTRWRSGFLPPVHLSRIRVELVEEEGSGGR